MRERAPKRRAFLLIFFSKSVLKRIFALFFQIFAWDAKNAAKTGPFLLWESSKNQFGRPKKRVAKYFEDFKKSPHEKILDPPVLVCGLLRRNTCAYYDRGKKKESNNVEFFCISIYQRLFETTFGCSNSNKTCRHIFQTFSSLFRSFIICFKSKTFTRVAKTAETCRAVPCAVCSNDQI